MRGRTGLLQNKAAAPDFGEIDGFLLWCEFGIWSTQKMLMYFVIF